MIPASWITFAHSGVSLLMSRGKLGRRVADRLEAEFVELFAHLRHRQGFDGFVVQFIQNVLRGVPAGASRPNHGTASKPGNPDSGHGRQIGRQRRAPA